MNLKYLLIPAVVVAAVLAGLLLRTPGTATLPAEPRAASAPPPAAPPADRPAPPSAPGATYVTWDQLEVDRCVAAWLICRFVDPSAQVVLLPAGTDVDAAAGVPFDVPGADWARSNQQCTSERVLATLDAPHPRLGQLCVMVRQLEFAYWMTPPDSPAAELQRRFIAARQAHPDAPQACLDAMLAELDNWYQGTDDAPAESKN